MGSDGSTVIGAASSAAGAVAGASDPFAFRREIAPKSLPIRRLGRLAAGRVPTAVVGDVLPVRARSAMAMSPVTSIHRPYRCANRSLARSIRLRSINAERRSDSA